MSSFLYDFSVIVPTRNRPQALSRCLESLAALNYPRDRFEVIIVDDGSDEPLDGVVAPWSDRMRCKLLRKTQGGPGVARNHGSAQACGQFLAFTDDDCAVTADWLAELRTQFAVTPDSLLGGRMVNALSGNLYSAACHTIIDAAYDYYDPAKGRAHFFPSSNFAMAAQGFRDIGGFDPGWALAAAEDRAFCYQWIRRGGALTCVPRATIYHYHSHTLKSYCELHVRYGRGAFHYQMLRTAGAEEGGLKPAWAFYWTCLRRPFENEAPGRALAIALLLGLWQFANAAGYFRERIRRR